MPECPTGKSLGRVALPLSNHFSISRRDIPVHPVGQIRGITSAVSSLNEGALAIVTNVGMGCGGRGSVGRASMIAGRFAVSDLRAPDERRLSPAKPFGEDGWLRTAKACGSGTRCWCQVGGGFVSPTGPGKTVNPPTTGT